MYCAAALQTKFQRFSCEQCCGNCCPYIKPLKESSRAMKLCRAITTSSAVSPSVAVCKSLYIRKYTNQKMRLKYVIYKTQPAFYHDFIKHCQFWRVRFAWYKTQPHIKTVSVVCLAIMQNKLGYIQIPMPPFRLHSHFVGTTHFRGPINLPNGFF